MKAKELTRGTVILTDSGPQKVKDIFRAADNNNYFVIVWANTFAYVHEDDNVETA